jgi:hypothetical protein
MTKEIELLSNIIEKLNNKNIYTELIISKKYFYFMFYNKEDKSILEELKIPKSLKLINKYIKLYAKIKDT